MVDAQQAAPDRVFSATLSALVPGAGQWIQGRVAAALHFYVDTVLIVALMIGIPAFRAPGILVFVALAAWSAVDAYRAPTRASDREG